MRLKIWCDGESEKFCKIFWELNNAPAEQGWRASPPNPKTVLLLLRMSNLLPAQAVGAGRRRAGDKMNQASPNLRKQLGAMPTAGGCIVMFWRNRQVSVTLYQLRTTILLGATAIAFVLHASWWCTLHDSSINSPTRLASCYQSLSPEIRDRETERDGDDDDARPDPSPSARRSWSVCVRWCQDHHVSHSVLSSSIGWYFPYILSFIHINETKPNQIVSTHSSRLDGE